MHKSALVRALGITILTFLLPVPAFAHFAILVTDTPSVKVGQEAAFRFYNGHPYECEVVDTAAPERVLVIPPKGEPVEIKASAGTLAKADGGKAAIHTFSYTPKVRGDHLVTVRTALAYDAHARAYVQDEVKLVLHVQTQEGWQQPAGASLELLPLTRPYGLEPGFVFKAQARLKGKPLADAEVEIEKFHAAPPKQIPDDEALITRTAITDMNGYVVCTLDEPGWWAIMVSTEDGRKAHEGKPVPILRRAQFWLKVGPKVDTPE